MHVQVNLDGHKAQRDFYTRIQNAKPEERDALFAERPAPEAMAPRFLALAEETTEKAVALKALSWVISRCRAGEVAGKALAIYREVLDLPRWCFDLEIALLAGH